MGAPGTVPDEADRRCHRLGHVAGHGRYVEPSFGLVDDDAPLIVDQHHEFNHRNHQRHRRVRADAGHEDPTLALVPMCILVASPQRRPYEHFSLRCVGKHCDRHPPLASTFTTGASECPRLRRLDITACRSVLVGTSLSILVFSFCIVHTYEVEFINYASYIRSARYR